MRPWSPQEVEERLADATEKLDEVVGEFKSLAERAGRAKATYEVAHARALLESKMTNSYSSVELHKAQATVDTEHQRMELELSGAYYASQRQVLETLRAQCEVLRTLLVQSRGVQDQRYQR